MNEMNEGDMNNLPEDDPEVAKVNIGGDDAGEDDKADINAGKKRT